MLLRAVAIGVVVGCAEPAAEAPPPPAGTTPTTPSIELEPGCLAIYAWDGDDDGHPDASGLERFDALGRPIASTRDWERDGVTDEASRWTWSDQGLVRTELDRDADGAADRVLTYAYDAQGRQIEATVFDPSAHVDTVTRSGWEDGRLAWTTDDLGRDGIVDRSTTYGYDARGKKVSEAIDTDGDGQPQWFYTFVWDEAGRKQRTEKDIQGDGKIEWTEDTVYAAATGRTGTTTTTGGLPDRPILSVTDRVYDEENRLVSERVDAAPIDGVLESEEVIGYDPATGQAVSWRGTMAVEGEVVAYDTRFTLDASGRLVEAVTELAWASGAASRERSTWTFSCP